MAHIFCLRILPIYDLDNFSTLRMVFHYLLVILGIFTARD